MKITIVPVRCIRSIWVSATFDTAQAYELRTQKGRLLLRRTSLAEVRRIAVMLDATRSSRSRTEVLGARWADAAPHVTRRNSKTLTRSNREG